MNASVHVASPASTSMFGLATWHDYHYYYGHVMWDIETFSVPVLSLVQPEAAEALLHYRSRSLEGARTNAQIFGRRGLQFPWESAPTTGQEAAPSPGTAAWHEDHVSLDVALAFAQYAHATGDQNFLRDRAWPVLSGVSDWLVSRTHKSRRGYEIRRSMGIAERKSESDNEAFTMLSAKAVLETTLCTAKELGYEAKSDWAEISDNLVLPIRDSCLVSHDGFRRNEEKGATPSPLMALFPLESDRYRDPRNAGILSAPGRGLYRQSHVVSLLWCMGHTQRRPSAGAETPGTRLWAIHDWALFADLGIPPRQIPRTTHGGTVLRQYGRLFDEPVAGLSGFEDQAGRSTRLVPAASRPAPGLDGHRSGADLDSWPPRAP